MAWKFLADMSPVERKMYWAVFEETMLHELPIEEHNHLPSGVEVIPPQTPEACSRVLLEWFDQELMTVMTTGTQANLPAESARTLLGDPSRWTPEHSLVFTVVGEAAMRERPHLS